MHACVFKMSALRTKHAYAHNRRPHFSDLPFCQVSPLVPLSLTLSSYHKYIYFSLLHISNHINIIKPLLHYSTLINNSYTLLTIKHNSLWYQDKSLFGISPSSTSAQMIRKNIHKHFVLRFCIKSNVTFFMWLELVLHLISTDSILQKEKENILESLVRLSNRLGPKKIEHISHLISFTENKSSKWLEIQVWV